LACKLKVISGSLFREMASSFSRKNLKYRGIYFSIFILIGSKEIGGSAKTRRVDVYVRSKVLGFFRKKDSENFQGNFPRSAARCR